MADLRTKLVFETDGGAKTIADILRQQKALQDSAAAAKALGEVLGVSAKEAEQLSKGLSPEQVKKFADALKAAKDAAKAGGVEFENLVDIIDQLDDELLNLGKAVDAADFDNLDLRDQIEGSNTALALFAADAARNLQQIARQAIDTGVQFEALRTQLGTALGGDIAAEQAFAQIQDFAATTPFQVNEITDAFVRLANRGVEPTVDQLTRIGDTASALQKPFGQVTEAILDINNTERWRELGIEVKTTGNKISGTFKGVTIEADRTVEGALRLIEGFGKLDGVAGGMARQSAQLGGAFSNLEDAQAALADSFTQTVGPAVEVVVRGLTDLINTALKLPAPVRTVGFAIAGIGVALGTALLGVVAFEAANGRLIVSQTAATVAKARDTIVTTAQTAATLAQAAANGTLTASQQAQLANLGALTAKTLLLGAALASVAIAADTAFKLAGADDDIEAATQNLERAIARVDEARAKSTKGQEAAVAASQLEANALKQIQNEIGPLQQALDGLRGFFANFTLNSILTDFNKLIPLPTAAKDAIQGLIDKLPQLETAANSALSIKRAGFAEFIEATEKTLKGIDDLRGKGFKASAEELKAQKVAIDNAISSLENYTATSEQELALKQIYLLSLKNVRAELLRVAGAQIDAAAAQQAILENSGINASRITLIERERLNALQQALNEGVTSEQKAAKERLAINRQRIEQEIAEEKDKLAKLSALQQSAGRDKAILESNQRLATLTGQLLESEVALRRQALDQITRATDEANAKITLSERQRLNQVQVLLNSQTITEQDAAAQRLAINEQRIRQEIAQEQQRLQQISRLANSEQTDQAEIASKQRLAQLTASLLDNEAAKQRQLREQIVRGLEQQGKAERLRADQQIGALGREKAAQDAILRTMEQQNRLADVKAALSRSGGELAATTGQIEIDQLSRALEIRERLDDPGTDQGVRAILQAQLNALGLANQTQEQILLRRQAAENNLAQVRAANLQFEQEVERQKINSDLERQRLALQRLEIESRINLLAAQRAAIETRVNAAKVLADPNATDTDRAAARESLQAAADNVAASQAALSNAQQQITAQDAVAEAARKKLAIDQAIATAQFNAAEQARLQAQQLQVAELRAKTMADNLERAARASQQTTEAATSNAATPVTAATSVSQVPVQVAQVPSPQVLTALSLIQGYLGTIQGDTSNINFTARVIADKPPVVVNQQVAAPQPSRASEQRR